jgi:hypothetical protein
MTHSQSKTIINLTHIESQQSASLTLEGEADTKSVSDILPPQMHDAILLQMTTDERSAIRVECGTVSELDFVSVAGFVGVITPAGDWVPLDEAMPVDLLDDHQKDCLKLRRNTR